MWVIVSGYDDEVSIILVLENIIIVIFSDICCIDKFV